MPKFITYQRPRPVNQASWGGGKSPFAPIRKPRSAPRSDGNGMQLQLNLPPLDHTRK